MVEHCFIHSELILKPLIANNSWEKIVDVKVSPLRQLQIETRILNRSAYVEKHSALSELLNLFAGVL